MKTATLSDQTAHVSNIGKVVSGKVVSVVPFGFWADVGLGNNAFADLRYIPGKQGSPDIPKPGDRITAVIIGYVEDEPRLSLLPEHIKSAQNAA